MALPFEIFRESIHIVYNVIGSRDKDYHRSLACFGLEKGDKVKHSLEVNVSTLPLSVMDDCVWC